MSVKFEDYYKVLGVERSASQDEIRSAYRRLARQYHPDLNSDPGAEERFKKINEAHEVLKDPKTRQQYDLLGENWKAGQDFRPPPGWGGAQNMNFGQGGDAFGGGGFSDFFKMFFGQGGASPFGASYGAGGPGASPFGGAAGGSPFGAGGFGGAAGPGGAYGAPQPPRPRELEMTVSLEDVYHGAKKTIQIPSPGGAPEVLTVRIPAGTTDGKAIRLSGKGDHGPGGRGDLLLRIRVAPHARFEADGHDLSAVVGISPWEAALGARINVPTLDGEVVMRIPAGVSSGSKMRLRGKGLPRNRSERGDLYAELQIRVPKPLSDEERALFEQLRDQSRFDPRS